VSDSVSDSVSVLVLEFRRVGALIREFLPLNAEGIFLDQQDAHRFSVRLALGPRFPSSGTSAGRSGSAEEPRDTRTP
jgi:hypothetical protein